MAELLVLNSPEELDNAHTKLSVGIEMKPLILFAGSQWDDESTSDSASLYRTLKSMLLDIFQGEEIPSIDVAGLQYVLMIAAGEPSTSATSDPSSDPSSKPVLHLRWYKIRTLRSNTPKVPRVELDPIGPPFDFRVGRFKLADHEIMKEALKHARRPNEARTKKNIETDLVGDKLGRVHLGKQDLSQLQTRKMKGLKRSRDHDDDGTGDVQMNGATNGTGPGDVDEDDDEDIVSQDGGLAGEDSDEEDDDDDDDENGVLYDDASSVGGTGDEIDIGDSDVEMQADEMPKRQRVR